ncbi:Dual specificity protein phosphatase 23 [Papilio machaon]|uniref:Dual specificity protein phosphatase 23 n=1 Tax=Papilio machaon TaxID=76193 RepID=A0A0N1IPE9_PAPMA|nr:Dual specificity protein phosphatase 23 [Papilio machaon]
MADDGFQVYMRMENITEQEDRHLAGARKEIRNDLTVLIPENPFPEIAVEAYPPLKFSWVIPKKLAAMAFPRNKENLQFLVNQGITNLVTLTAGKKPPVDDIARLRWTEIPIEEFELPTIEQIKKFIDVCKRADKNGEKLTRENLHFDIMADDGFQVYMRMENITEQEDRHLAGARKEIRNDLTVLIPENPFPEIAVEAYPPLKFSWVIPKKLAAMAFPRNKENLQFLVNQGITNLVMGIHCRQGRSRCGVMLACYLVHFHRFLPDQACNVIRMMRPGSLDFPEQEEVVDKYFEHLTEDNPLRFGVSGEVMEEFIEAARESTKHIL